MMNIFHRSALLFLICNSYYGIVKADPQNPTLSSKTVSNSRTEDIAQLNPAFIYTPMDVKLAVKRGELVEKKGRKIDWLINRNRQNPFWVRGNGGRSHDSYVWCSDLDGIFLSSEAYQAASLYTTDKQLQTLETTGAIVQQLEFTIHLTSVPHIARWIWQKNKKANPGDVTVIKFVLSDDHNHFFTATSDALSHVETKGSISFSGVTPVHSFSNVNVSGDYNYSATFNRTDFVPWTVAKPYYSANYHVYFPLFDKNGMPRIKSDVKKLTLHIITQTGELDANFTLNRKKKLM